MFLFYGFHINFIHTIYETLFKSYWRFGFVIVIFPWMFYLTFNQHFTHVERSHSKTVHYSVPSVCVEIFPACTYSAIWFVEGCMKIWNSCCSIMMTAFVLLEVVVHLLGMKEQIAGTLAFFAFVLRLTGQICRDGFTLEATPYYANFTIAFWFTPVFFFNRYLRNWSVGRDAV